MLQLPDNPFGLPRRRSGHRLIQGAHSRAWCWLQDVSGWALKMEVLRLLVALTVNWRRLVQRHLPALLQQCWALFTGCVPLYTAAVVAADADLDDGEVLTCSRSHRVVISVLRPALQPLTRAGHITAIFSVPLHLGRACMRALQGS